MIFFTTRAASIAERAPSRYMPNSTRPRTLTGPRLDPAGTRMPTSRTYTGRRAEQVARGALSIVAMRSLADGIVRVAMMPGMAQANEESMATKARPSSPARLMTLSMRNAARDM